MLQKADEGWFECQISSTPVISHLVYLNIAGENRTLHEIIWEPSSSLFELTERFIIGIIAFCDFSFLNGLDTPQSLPHYRALHSNSGQPRHLPGGRCHHEPHLPCEGQPRAPPVHLLVSQPAAHLLLLHPGGHQPGDGEGGGHRLLPPDPAGEAGWLRAVRLSRLSGEHQHRHCPRHQE